MILASFYMHVIERSWGDITTRTWKNGFALTFRPYHLDEKLHNIV